MLVIQVSEVQRWADFWWQLRPGWLKQVGFKLNGDPGLKAMREGTFEKAYPVFSIDLCIICTAHTCAHILTHVHTHTHSFSHIHHPQNGRWCVIKARVTNFQAKGTWQSRPPPEAHTAEGSQGLPKNPWPFPALGGSFCEGSLLYIGYQRN